MTGVPGLEPGDDSRDWPRDGIFLRPISFAFDASSLTHGAGRSVANVLARDVPDVHGVYLTGSVLEPGATPADIDLAVIVRDDAPPEVEPNVRAIVAGLASPLPGCAWDVLVDRRGALARQPLRCLAIAVRSLRLSGPPLWSSPPAIRADVSTASRLFAPRKRELIQTVRALLASLTDDPATAPLWLEKTQKRALRIGMLEAFARFGSFATDPRRCAELVARAFPEVSGLALEVARDLSGRLASEDALSRATDLVGALLSSSSLNAASEVP